MKTIKNAIQNNTQLTAFVISTLVLAVTFTTMVLVHGFKAF